VRHVLRSCFAARHLVWGRLVQGPHSIRSPLRLAQLLEQLVGRTVQLHVWGRDAYAHAHVRGRYVRYVLRSCFAVRHLVWGRLVDCIRFAHL
jgi:hypothetical protein